MANVNALHRVVAERLKEEGLYIHALTCGIDQQK